MSRLFWLLAARDVSRVQGEAAVFPSYWCIVLPIVDWTLLEYVFYAFDDEIFFSNDEFLLFLDSTLSKTASSSPTRPDQVWLFFLSVFLSLFLSFFSFFFLPKFWISLFFLRSVPTSLLRQHSSFLPQHYFTGGKKLGIIKISSFWYSYTRIVCQSHMGKTYFIRHFENVKGPGPS